jgi:uncharacterized protein YgiM (DUF1202 family)
MSTEEIKPKRTSPYLIIIAAFLLLLAVMAVKPTVAYAIPAFEEATITADDVNMRLRPDTDSPVVLKFKKGTRIGVFTEEGKDWYRIIYGNYRGYVNKDYVFLPSADNLVGHALSDGVNIRQNPGEFSNVVGKVNAGAAVTIKNISGDWYEVQTDEGVTGFVSKTLVKESTSKKAASLLKQGMSGAEVSKMQKKLRDRGFFAGSITGYFGDQTVEAIKAFQGKAKMHADGVAGEKTLEVLYSDNDIKTTASERAGIKGKVLLTPWDKMQNILKKGMYFRITDVKTGLSWRAYRFGGWWHADSEPATAKDTAIYKKVYGGHWSWNRRAVWVTVGSHTYAASIHGMPHMVDVIRNNDFPGHMCVHFLHSKVHQTGKECPRHQAMVQYAYRVGNKV